MIEKSKGKPQSSGGCRSDIVFLMLVLFLFGGLRITIHIPLPTPSTGFCGDGPVHPWSVKPTEEQATYVVLTTENTNGALLSDNIRKTETVPQGILVGYAGSLGDNLSFVSPTSIETCQSGSLKVHGHINDILYDEVRHEIWIATDGDGTYHYMRGSWRQYTTDDGLNSDIQYSVTQDLAGLIYVGTYEGVSVYSRATDRFSKAPGLNPSDMPNHIHDLLLSQNGSAFLATIGDGLIMIKNDQVTLFRVDELVGISNVVIVPELGSNNIRVLKEAPDGKIWVGSDPGLALYDPATGTWQDREPMPKPGTFQVLGIDFDYGSQIWVTGSVTRALSETMDNFHWLGGYTISLGRENWGFDRDTVVIGTHQGLYLGAMSSEAPQ